MSIDADLCPWQLTQNIFFSKFFLNFFFQNSKKNFKIKLLKININDLGNPLGGVGAFHMIDIVLGPVYSTVFSSQLIAENQLTFF